MRYLTLFLSLFSICLKIVLLKLVIEGPVIEVDSRFVVCEKSFETVERVTKRFCVVSIIIVFFISVENLNNKILKVYGSSDSSGRAGSNFLHFILDSKQIRS